MDSGNDGNMDMDSCSDPGSANDADIDMDSGGPRGIDIESGNRERAQHQGQMSPGRLDITIPDLPLAALDNPRFRNVTQKRGKRCSTSKPGSKPRAQRMQRRSLDETELRKQVMLLGVLH